jgi:hypothetical protein
LVLTVRRKKRLTLLLQKNEQRTISGLVKLAPAFASSRSHYRENNSAGLKSTERRIEPGFTLRAEAS